jgi:predicted DNA-binding transcriptional regulator AlpA
MTAKKKAAKLRPEFAELLTLSDICGWLKLHVSSVHRLRKDPDFPRPVSVGAPIKSGHRASVLRWSRLELEDYLTSRRAASAIPPPSAAR